MANALVVDDSRAIRAILSKTLRELGFEVAQASNGGEALDCMLREGASIRLALVDWNMPVMNGIDFVRKVRARPAWQDTCLLMVTTETEIEQVMLALAAGANEYIMKPFTADVVRDKLRLLGVIE